MMFDLMTRKGKERLKRSQTSTGFIDGELGRLEETER